MVVQHNLTAMNANRLLGVTTSSQAKATEKLSSGYKINRAADDAAGLSISEKMRKQIRGLSQASDNAEDGISAVQTAEGALAEVHDMLQRMNELAIKASNETNSASDRDTIQDEIDQLVTEIDRVSETTKFNETYLLKGGETTNGYSRAFAANGTAIGTVKDIEVETGAATQTITDGDKIALGGIGLKSSATGVVANVAATAIAGYTAAQKKMLERLSSITVSGTNANVDVTLKDGTTASYTAADFTTAFGLATIADGTTSFSKQLDAPSPAGTPNTKGDAANADLSKYKYGEQISAWASVDGDGTINLSMGENKALVIDLQVGADTTRDNKITLSIESMSAQSLGVDGLRVDGTDSTNADEAVNTIADAIASVSAQRSELGAVQNRLEHTISNLDNVVENTTAAESQIRDTDMAAQMVEYSKNNILQQAGQSMLAQANQSTQGVLALLQ